MCSSEARETLGTSLYRHFSEYNTVDKSRPLVVDDQVAFPSCTTDDNTKGQFVFITYCFANSSILCIAAKNFSVDVINAWISHFTFSRQKRTYSYRKTISGQIAALVQIINKYSPSMTVKPVQPIAIYRITHPYMWHSSKSVILLI